MLTGKNNSATTSGNYGDLVITKAESEGSGNAFATSISQGYGNSRAEATVMEGKAIATGIHKNNELNDNSSLSPANLDINFTDPFFGPEFIDPFNKKDVNLNKILTTTQSTEIETTSIQSESTTGSFELENLSLTTEKEIKRMSFQMGRTFGGSPSESSEEQSTTEALAQSSKADEIKLNGQPSDNTQLSSVVIEMLPVICQNKGNETTWSCILYFDEN